LSEGAIHTIGFILALTLITYLHVVLGEMVPKSLSLQNAERVVLFLARPMALSEKLFALPVRILNLIGLGVLKLIRVQPPEESRQVYTAEELELIVSESYAGGVLAEREHELVTNILDFSERRVVHVMTPRTQMDAVPVTIGEEELIERFNQSNHTRLPVYDGSIDHVLGIAHLKDLVRLRLSGKPLDLRVMMRQVPLVPETLPVETVLAAFRRQRVHMAIVLDEHGGTAGLVTLEDLIEEVVGEVRDEFEQDEQPPVEQVGPGHLVAAGTALIEDIEGFVDLGDPVYEVNTIGGLVVAELGRPPQEGIEVQIGSAQIRVEEVAGLSVERVSIRYPVEDS
jgi:CBS domain containing-hemolysin-like protein